MEVVLILLLIVLVVMLAICWVQSDKIRELACKNTEVSKEVRLLRSRNYQLEVENKAFKNNLRSNNEIICYTCGGNGDCTEGCRFTKGADGCGKYRRGETE